jgi:hypothetical protein
VFADGFENRVEGAWQWGGEENPCVFQNLGQRGAAFGEWFAFNIGALQQQDVQNVVRELVTWAEFTAILEDLKGGLAFGVCCNDFAVEDSGVGVDAGDCFCATIDFLLPKVGALPSFFSML